MTSAILAACAPDEGYSNVRLRPRWGASLQVLEAGPGIDVLLVPSSADQLAALTERKRGRLWRRCRKMLLGAGVDYLYLAPALLGLEGAAALTEGFSLPEGRTLLRALVGDMLRVTAKQEGIDLLACEVGLWQSSFDEEGYAVLRAIADTARFATIYTDAVESAGPYAERLFYDTGLSPGVTSQLSDMARCDLVVLLEPCLAQIAGDRAVVIDLAMSGRSGCLNQAYFSLLPDQRQAQMAAVLPFLGQADARAVEFLLCAGAGCTARPSELARLAKKLGFRLTSVSAQAGKKNMPPRGSL